MIVGITGRRSIMQSNFNHLVPDYTDSSENMLASFPSIRSKTLETLYGSHDDDEHDDDSDTTCALPQRRKDKSPKGSVDEAIRDLVNLINAHPSFATLSSCSGRIALYDPSLLAASSSLSSTPSRNTTAAAAQRQEQQQQEERPDSLIDEHNGDNVDARPAAAARSGKGGTGGWLLASHEVVEPTILVDLLQQTPKDHDDDADDAIGSDDNDKDEDHVLSFKMEPLLLHVAAANLTRGRQLLQIALSSVGLRESGLVVTESRVTVALRGQALALSVPLARRRRRTRNSRISRNNNHNNKADDYLRPNDEYLVALVQQANRRLQRNLEKISHLFEAVQSQIFRPNNRKCSSLAVLPAITCRIRASPLPALNLWRHASVIVPSRHFSNQEPERERVESIHQEEEVELLVFGGYGSGPSILNGSNGNNHDEADVNNNTTISPIRRSDKVYRLRRNMKGSWSETWEEVNVISTTNSGNNLGTNQETETPDIGAAFNQTCLGLKVRSVDFTAREGLAACYLSVSSSSSSTKDVIALFGGRQGPNRPLNDLIFFDNAEDDNDGSMPQHSFQAPIDVRGTPPVARWGHSFTSVSLPESNDNINGGRRRDSGGEQRPLALVVGGRNDSQTFASIHVLSIVAGVEEGNETSGQESSHAHLVWTEVMESAACRPRFYHAAATAMSSTHNSQTFVFGGLWNAQNLLGGNEVQDDTAGLVVDTTPTTTTMSSAASVAPLPCPTPFDTLFGHSVSLLPGGQANSNGLTYMSIGGIPRVAEDECSDEAFLPIRCVTLKPPTGSPPPPLPPSNSSTTLFFDQDKGKEDKLKLQNQKGSWIVQEHSVEFSDNHDDSTSNNNDRQSTVNDLGCLVHHSCNLAQTRRGTIISNEFQVLVVGGGVQGFAFGPIFGKSHLLTVRVSSSNEGDDGPCTNATLDDRALVERRAASGRNGGGQHGYARETIKAHAAPNGGNKNEQQRETNVLYVTTQDAKMVKTLLEEARLLDKEYRMGPAIRIPSLESPADTTTTTRTLIAVPVTPDCLDLLRRFFENDGTGAASGPLTAAARWQPLVQGSGRQHMSFSSSVFAARRARKKEFNAANN